MDWFLFDKDFRQGKVNYQYVSFDISRVGFTLLLPQFREYCKNTISVERILSILKNNALIRDRFSIMF